MRGSLPTKKNATLPSIRLLLSAVYSPFAKRAIAAAVEVERALQHLRLGRMRSPEAVHLPE